MTEIHTCSYACQRIECIRAQRDELAARLTTETSNARGDAYTFDMIEEAWGDAVPLTKPYFDRFRARLETLRQFAAEGVHAGEVSAYDLAVLDDAAETLDRIGDGSAGLRAARARIASAMSQQPEGVQAGEVEQRARELLAAELRADMRPGAAEEAESGKLGHDPAMRAIVAALSQQPEARGDATARLASKARELQRKYYGDGAGLHLEMIDWAREFDALTGERNG